METIKLVVNGVEIEARSGTTILETVREQGLDEIPTLCHADGLEPYGSCFLCVVEVKGRPSLVPACATRVAPGMDVTTKSERVTASRKTALELLLSNHYADCAPPCRLACPAGVDTQGYVALAAMGRLGEALALVREANPLPAVCGRVCVRRCEAECRRAELDGPVGINAVKRFLSDAPGAYDGVPSAATSTGKSVGIVGGGPAGLSAAWFLRRKGHAAVVYEAMPKAGGMLRYGIPVYRLPDEALDRDIDHIRKTGAVIRTGVRIGTDLTLAELRERHDALFIAAGGWSGNPMGVDGEFETEGVLKGIDFLREKSITREAVGGTVVVVGGGNTAIDVARTAKRLGADKVILLYRRTRAEMPADPMEIGEGVEEGVELMELAAPTGLVAENGKIKAMRCIRMKLGEKDKSGRRRPVPLEGSEFDLPCRWAISAIGQAPLLDGLLSVGDSALATTKWGTIAVDPATLATNVPGVFAGGDVADDGPTVVVDAIGDGRKAALAVHEYLTGEKPARAPFLVSRDFWGKPAQAEFDEVRASLRREVPTLDAERRAACFDEVAIGYDADDLAHEASRCLSCGCVRLEDCSLRAYAEDYGVDMNRFKGQIRKHKIDERHPHIVYDPNKCILCALCVRTCGHILPLSAVGLVGRGFRTEMRPAMNDPLSDTSCVSCGNCIDVCPTGALTERYPYPGRAALSAGIVESHCALCSLACPIGVKTRGGNRYTVGPSKTDGGYLCRYGRFGAELFIKRRRVSTPFLRSAAGQAEASFADAYRSIAAALKQTVAQYGPESVGVFVSPELSSEELYLAGLIARRGLGTGNIGSLSLAASGFGALPSFSGQGEGWAASVAAADLIVCGNTDLETDHLVLNIAITDAVRRGAKLVVANSSLDKASKELAVLALDPMRGTAALLWDAVLRCLIEDVSFPAASLEALAGWVDFKTGPAFDSNKSLERIGVGADLLQRLVGLIREARRIVFVTCPDRAQDRAEGDLDAVGNLVLALRASGVQAELLLPRAAANAAGLEAAGADPAFGPGRLPAASLPGASTLQDLRRTLEEGRLKAALVIGEDPFRHDRYASWFRGVEFLGAMDWTDTETTRGADVVLPLSTALESEGTRVSFDGRSRAYARCVEPPSGKAGWEVLAGLAAAFGLEIEARRASDLTRALESAGASAGGGIPARLLAVPASGKAAAVVPLMTTLEGYKQDLRQVGVERYRIP